MVDKRTDNDRQVRREAVKSLVRQTGWRVIDNILFSQYQEALTKMKTATKIEEFLSIQATLNQIEGLVNQIKGEISDFGIKQTKKATGIQGE